MKMLAIQLLLVVIVGLSVVESSPGPVTSLLRSSWNYTPFLLEGSEFLWEYDENIFWKFVDLSKALYHDFSSDQVVYESVVKIVENLLPSSVYNMFVFSLALHLYSPTVQIFHQISTEARNEMLAVANTECDDIFMDVHGHFVCSVEAMLELVAKGVDHNDSVPQLYKFDHQFSVDSDDAPLVVLYGELGTSTFSNFHSALMEMAMREKIRYVFRHHYKGKNSQGFVLSGYGVQLSVKSTEYRAVDDTQVEGGDAQVVTNEEEKVETGGFIFYTLQSRYPEKDANLKEFEAHLLQGAREMPELKLWQLQDLGFQAAQRVVTAGSDFGLKALKDISQNLPIQAKSLCKVQVDKDVRKEIQANQKVLSEIGISQGSSVLLVNGIIIQKDNVDIFQLLQLLITESQMLDSLNGLGIDPDAYPALLSLPVHRSESSQVVLDMRSKVVMFVNDLEKDRVYRSWAKSLKEFLRPTYPGMLRQIARNAFNIVFMFDPVSTSGVEMVEYVKLFLDHLVPARFGLVLLPDHKNEAAVAVCQGFSYLSINLSPKEALRWLFKAQQLFLSHGNLSVDNVLALFQDLFSKSLDDVSMHVVFSEQWDNYRKEASSFFYSKGFNSLPQVLINGVLLDVQEEDLETAIVTQMQHQTFTIQQALFTKELKEKDNVFDYFMSKPGVLSRINRHVLAKSKVFDLSLPGYDGSTLTNRLKYLRQPTGEFTVKELSAWVVVDLNTDQGRLMALDAVKYSLNNEQVRVAIVHNTDEALLSRAVQALSSSQLKFELVLSCLKTILNLPPTVSISSVLDACNETLHSEAMMQLLFSERTNSSIVQHTHFSRVVLGLGAGQNALISNGKLIGPLSDGEVFSEADWDMLYSVESETYASSLVSMVDSLSVKDISPDEDTSSYRSDLVMKLASLLRKHPKRNRLSKLPSLLDQHSVLHLPPLDPDLYLTVIAILDPLSADTQRFAPILQTLHAALSVDLTVFFNPVAKLSQMPTSSFYRYVLQPELNFYENGSINENLVAIFSDLPTSPLFTLSLDVPHSWLVEPVFSPHDLDNIHLKQVSDGSIHAEFVLEHILVEGQCFDAQSDQPTPGLEFVLGTGAYPGLYDTIVMANLGYFQLKATPGAWKLRLREGRSKEIYFIHSYSGGGDIGRMEELVGDEVLINVKSFTGAAVTLKVRKKIGMEDMELLTDEVSEEKMDAEPSTGGLWHTLSNMLGSTGEIAANSKVFNSSHDETINIFSIASGHLYERFLRIMMLSVLKHTDNPVKFWFLKNYLSPTFKEFIPFMAKHYGFEYELVEYRWPRWLHPQTQKQRLIWGYKILFLDVLFPLSIKKIIFVDADQIVRADLKELLEMPLDGAPYAYTPFCDSRPDMEGFRFWEKGYWKSHLGSRRYHISALYVVDLVVFRHLAAGDRLRGQYQALSQDPNSLSNLDQDLPNNMIHSVPIKSLPQEWLWCETWCSQETKSQAKTIDLCNNPLTKEPKLDSAVRIVPEWTSYDNEIKSHWTSWTADRTVKNAHMHTEL